MPFTGNDIGTEEGEDDLTQNDQDHLVKPSSNLLCGETVYTLGK